MAPNPTSQSGTSASSNASDVGSTRELIIGVSSSLLVLCVISYTIRAVSRVFNNAALWFDDALMLLGLV